MTKPDRFRQLERDHFDVIVIGAGTGGLTAAALLARRGRRVLVVERHYVAGGNATIFRRPGYAFDIGLHYIGGCAPGGAIPRILEAAGAPDIRFNRLDPNASDIFVLPDFTISVPNDLARFRQRLLERFPDEGRGVDRFFRLLRQVDHLGELAADPAAALRLLPRSLLALRYRNATLARFLASCTADRRLRAVLAGWQVVYALPPSRVSALVHAGAAMHYISGAYYPSGGGQVLSDRLAQQIEASGGKLLLATTARRIIVEKRRVRGIELESRHLGRRRVDAPVVISNADIQHTLLRLVDAIELPPRTRQRTAHYQWPAALAVLYLGVKRDLAAEGITDATYAIYPEYDVEPLYAATSAGEFYPRPYTCLSVPTLKDPGNRRLAPPGIHNVQLMAVAPSAPQHWGIHPRELDDRSYRENVAYQRCKQQYGNAMIAQAERLLPGLGRDIVFREMATPLTHRRYTNSSAGTGYGIALTPDQILLRRPPARTPIKGLVLAGASLRTMHGIIGAMHSGLAAADEVLGGGLAKEVLGDPQAD